MKEFSSDARASHSQHARAGARRIRRHSGIMKDRLGVGAPPHSSAPIKVSALDPQIAMDSLALERQFKRLAFVDGSGKKPCSAIEAKIGGGAFGRTYRMRNTLENSMKAVKVLESNRDARGKLVTSAEDVRAAKEKTLLEVRNLLRLHSPYIVQYFGAGEDEQTQRLIIIMELCKCSLLDKLKDGGFTVAQARTYTHEIAEGIKYLHDMNFVHRDLKLDNIFLSYKNVCCIGDFGLAREVFEGATSSASNTLAEARGHKVYRSPEACTKGTIATYSDDCWAFGLIITELATGKTVIQRVREATGEYWPVHFQQNILDEILRETRENDLTILAPLAESLLEIHPTSRLTAAQVISAYLELIAASSSGASVSERPSQVAFDSHQFMMEQVFNVKDEAQSRARGKESTMPEQLPGNVISRGQKPTLTNKDAVNITGNIEDPASGRSFKLASLKNMLHWPSNLVVLRGIDELLISFLDAYGLKEYATVFGALGYRDQLDLALGVRDKEECRKLARAVGMKPVHALKFEQKWRQNFYARRPSRTQELLDLLVQRAEKSEAHGLEFWLKAVRLESYGAELRAEGVDSVSDLRDYVSFVYKGGVGQHRHRSNSTGGARRSAYLRSKGEGPSSSSPDLIVGERAPNFNRGLKGMKVGSLGNNFTIETSNRHDERRFDIALRRRGLLNKFGMLMPIEDEQAAKLTLHHKKSATLTDVMHADNAHDFAEAIGDLLLTDMSTSSEVPSSGKLTIESKTKAEQDQTVGDHVAQRHEHDLIAISSKSFEDLKEKFETELQDKSPGTLLTGEVFQRRKRGWLKAFGKTWRVSHLDISKVGTGLRQMLELKVWRGGRGIEHGEIPETIILVSCDVHAESCAARPKKNSQGISMSAWHIVDSDGEEINTTGTSKLFPMACSLESEAKRWVQAINTWCEHARNLLQNMEKLEAEDTVAGTPLISKSRRKSLLRQGSFYRRQSYIVHDLNLQRTNPSLGKYESLRDAPNKKSGGEMVENSWYDSSHSGQKQRRKSFVEMRQQDEFYTFDTHAEYHDLSVDDGVYESIDATAPSTIEFGIGLLMSVSPPENNLDGKSNCRDANSKILTQILHHDSVSCTLKCDNLSKPPGNSGRVAMTNGLELTKCKVYKIVDTRAFTSRFNFDCTAMILPSIDILESLRDHMQLIYDFGGYQLSDAKQIGINIRTNEDSKMSSKEKMQEKNAEKLIKISKEWCFGGPLSDIIHGGSFGSADTLDTVAILSITLSRALSQNHEVGLIHGALCLSNIYLAGKDDFTAVRIGGLCIGRWMRNHVASEQPLDYHGTMYLAPEEVSSKAPSNLPSTDMWRLGLILLQIALMEDWEVELNGAYKPIDPRSIYSYLDRLREGEDPHKPNRVIALIKRCLDADPKCRPSALEAQRLMIGATDATLTRHKIHAEMVDEMLLTVELEVVDDLEHLSDDIQLCSSAGLGQIKIGNITAMEAVATTELNVETSQPLNAYQKRKRLGERSMSAEAITLTVGKVAETMSSEQVTQKV